MPRSRLTTVTHSLSSSLQTPHQPSVVSTIPIQIKKCQVSTNEVLTSYCSDLRRRMWIDRAAWELQISWYTVARDAAG